MLVPVDQVGKCCKIANISQLQKQLSVLPENHHNEDPGVNSDDDDYDAEVCRPESRETRELNVTWIRSRAYSPGTKPSDRRLDTPRGCHSGFLLSLRTRAPSIIILKVLLIRDSR